MCIYLYLTLISTFQHPWTVGFTKDIDGERELHCSGSIIEASTILTAAHCFDPAYDGTPRNPERDLTVIVGAKDLKDKVNDFDEPTVTAKIKGFIIHPGYQAWLYIRLADLKCLVLFIMQKCTYLSEVGVVASKYIARSILTVQPTSFLTKAPV